MRVLPEPVGAATSVERPLRICDHAAAWASVGAGKVFLNQLETAAWKGVSAVSAMDVVGVVDVVDSAVAVPAALRDALEGRAAFSAAVGFVFAEVMKA